MSLEDKVRKEMIERNFVFSDIHYPEHDEKALNVAEQVLADFKPDRIIYLGDTYDATPVSHWLKDKKQALENKRLLKDYQAIQSMIDRHAKLAGNSLKEIVYMQGNHCDWIREYIERNPEVDGLINIENHLKSPSKNVKFTMLPFINSKGKNDRVYQIGKLYLIHGDYTNKYHSSKTVDTFGRNVMYAHTHSVQETTKVNPIDVEDRHMAVSIGCLADRNPKYMEGRPNAWVHAFALVYVQKNGDFNHYVVRISNGKTVAPWGKLYESKR